MSSLALDPRRRPGPVTQLVLRIAAAFGLGRLARTRRDARERRLRALIDAGRAVGLTDAEIVEALAERLYREAASHGAAEADVGLWGLRLYRHEARALVARAPRPALPAPGARP